MFLTLAAETAAVDASIWSFSELIAPQNIGPNLVALLTLTLLEIVLGIDNIVFIAILAAKLPAHQQDKARKLGLSLAVVTRVALLLLISFVLKLAEKDLFHLNFLGLDHHYTWKDLVITVGGLFLLAKGTHEIHGYVEGDAEKEMRTSRGTTFGMVIVQILAIDVVFSVDSVITAVGMAKNIYVMIAAVVISVGVMIAASGSISRFIQKHPTMKMLALAFLLMIGVLLVAESFGAHISKGYLYFAMAFSLAVEVLNMRRRRRRGLDESKVRVPVAQAT